MDSIEEYKCILRGDSDFPFEEHRMKIKRNGNIYTVLKQIGDEVCVEHEFDFAEPPHKRMLKMWWELKYCEILEDEDG